jgi:hypothetical protein
MGMGEWRPIEMAPKEDGKVIIVYRPIANDYIPHVGIDYWSTRLGNVWAKSNSSTPPTHWMPLPHPPARATPTPKGPQHEG